LNAITQTLTVVRTVKVKHLRPMHTAAGKRVLMNADKYIRAACIRNQNPRTHIHSFTIAQAGIVQPCDYHRRAALFQISLQLFRNCQVYVFLLKVAADLARIPGPVSFTLAG
jgi:hypothetical protein